ncbi:hypothetical protein [Occultella gossypii]|uniref:Uncharacterized protein n=1 Tax=Occultella gossypii TaxID=2800820 RepID=A0ABS7SF49_9MICO|nr:hypothetical protein [Occultella gossypii]MBZ2198862.1 hypothetical protein [Occultella gossypii]
MNTRTEEPLDDFESRLLGELRDVVALRTPAAIAAPARKQGVPPRRRWVIAGVAAATVGLTIWGLGTTAGPPAYAVSENSAGDVSFILLDADEAAGLETALASHGIAADVTLLPQNTTCATGRFAGENEYPDWMAEPVIADAGVTVTVPAGALNEGETLVVVYIGTRDGLQPGEMAATSVAVADGPVGECVPVPVSDE